jgi:hypothetical protein
MKFGAELAKGITNTCRIQLGVAKSMSAGCKLTRKNFAVVGGTHAFASTRCTSDVNACFTAIPGIHLRDPTRQVPPAMLACRGIAVGCATRRQSASDSPNGEGRVRPAHICARVDRRARFRIGGAQRRRVMLWRFPRPPLSPWTPGAPPTAGQNVAARNAVMDPTGQATPEIRAPP